MHSKLRQTWNDERGMSIIELLISTILSLIVLSAALEFYVSQHMNWLMQNDVIEVQQNARVCVDEIAGSLRMAGFGLPAGHPAFVIGTDSLTVYAANGSDVDTTLYFIRNRHEHNPYLARQINKQHSEVYSDDVEALTVTEITPRHFEITLTSRSERPNGDFIGGDGYRRRTVTTEVLARNLAIH